MPSVLDALPRGSRIAVLRLRSLGDSVLTTPALDILKRHRPDLRLAVMVEERFRPVFEENGDIDDILPVSLVQLRAWKPSLCLNLHGGTRSAWLTAASGAALRVGFAHYRNRLVYNLRIPRAQQVLGMERKVHTAEHLASAVFWLGAPRVDIPRAKLGGVRASAPQSRGAVILHPVAAAPAKTWLASHFLGIAELLKTSGLDPVFIGAATDDLAPFHAFRTVAGAPLAELKSLLASASLFIGNDSGPAHMAAAAGLPVIVIFGASDPEIWGPWRTASEAVTAPGGIENVSIAQVLAAVSRMRVHV